MIIQVLIYFSLGILHFRPSQQPTHHYHQSISQGLERHKTILAKQMFIATLWTSPQLKVEGHPQGWGQFISFESEEIDQAHQPQLIDCAISKFLIGQKV